MTRGERKVAAQAALKALWEQGWKWRQVAAMFKVAPRVVSQWNAGALAPNHATLYRLQELAYPEVASEVAGMVRRIREGLAELAVLDKVLTQATRMLDKAEMK